MRAWHVSASPNLFVTQSFLSLEIAHFSRSVGCSEAAVRCRNVADLRDRLIVSLGFHLLL